MGPKPTDIVAALRLARAPGALVELGSNENSFGPSPRVIAALREVAIEEIYRYPDPLGNTGLAQNALRANGQDLHFESGLYLK